jgi:hypothetical protein
VRTAKPELRKTKQTRGAIAKLQYAAESRHFSRSDSLKRQLVIWAGYDPMVLQRVEYFDMAGPYRTVFKGTFNEAL